MKYLSVSCLSFLLLGTGCYTQIYVEPEEFSESIASPEPIPAPPGGGPIVPPFPYPPIDRPILIVPPSPPPVIVVVGSPAPTSGPVVIRDSGTQRPSHEQRDDRSSRPISFPSRSR